MDVTAKFAALIVGTQYEKMQSATVEVAKDLILDDIGNTLAGTSESCAAIMRSFVMAQEAKPVASVLGSGARTSAMLAALANGVAANALDFNPAVIGGSSLGPLVPAILAAAEAQGSSGKEILEAYVAGHEIIYRIGQGYQQFGIEQVHGQHTAGIVGLMGAAAAVAKLLKVDQAGCQSILGVAASLASGLLADLGYDTKTLHVGAAAANAVLSGDLVIRGFTANPGVIEQPTGFAYSILAAGDMRRIDYQRMVGAGEGYHLARDGVNIKRYCSCRHNQAAINALLTITQEYGVACQDVKSIELEVASIPPFFHEKPANGFEGKFSFQYVLAAALRDGEITQRTFADSYAANPELRGIMARVHITEKGDGSAEMPTRVTLRLKDGRSYAREVTHPIGHPRNPMPRVTVQRKFRENAATLLNHKQIQSVVSMVGTLESVKHVSELLGQARISTGSP